MIFFSRNYDFFLAIMIFFFSEIILFSRNLDFFFFAILTFFSELGFYISQFYIFFLAILTFSRNSENCFSPSKLDFNSQLGVISHNLELREKSHNNLFNFLFSAKKRSSIVSSSASVEGKHSLVMSVWPNSSILASLWSLIMCQSQSCRTLWNTHTPLIFTQSPSQSLFVNRSLKCWNHVAGC